MNPEVLKDLYERATSKGYSKSIEEFTQLISSNQEVLDDNFDYVKTKGYSKDISEFSKLVGFGVKKKEDSISVTPEQNVELVSEDTSLGTPTPPINQSETLKGEENTILENVVGKNFLTDFVGDIYRAGKQGFVQGNTADESYDLMFKGSDASPQDIAEFIQSQQELASLGETDEMSSFNKIYEESGGGVLGFLKGLAYNPSVAAQLAAQTVTQMLNPATAGAAGAVVATGAGVGAMGFGVGAIPGAIAALPVAYGATGMALETGMSFAEFLREEVENNGDNFDESGIQKVLADEDAMFNIRAKSAGRGAVIGLIDRYTMKMGGKIVGKQAIKGASKGKRFATATAIEGVGGGVGEATARLAVGQDMDAREIGFEAIGGAGKAPFTYAYSKLKSKPVYKINGGEVDLQTYTDMVNKASDKDFAAMKFEVSNDSDIKDLTQARKNKLKTQNQVIKEVGQDNITNKETLNELVNLETEKQNLGDPQTEGGKKRLAELKKKIKDLQENPLEEEVAIEDEYSNLSTEDKVELQERAVNEIETEMAEQGVEDYDLTDEMINKRASDIFNKEISILDESIKEENIKQEDLKDDIKFSVAEEGDALVSVDAADSELIQEEMNNDFPESEVNFESTTEGGGVNVSPFEDSNSTQEFTDTDAVEMGFESKEKAVKPIEYFNGIPMITGISDTAAGGTIKDSKGGDMEAKGGIMFNALAKVKAAWAGVKPSTSEGQFKNAVKLYKKNKPLFDRLWKEGKLPNGQIPMAIIRMGNDAINSNEIVFRYLSPEINAQSQENQTAALNDLIAGLKVKKGKQNPKLLKFISDNKITTLGALINAVVKDANARAKGNYKTTLTLDERAALYNNLTSPEGIKKANKPFLKSLYKGTTDNSSVFLSDNIYNAVGEPSMMKTKKGDIVSIVGVDVLDGGVVDIEHGNYGSGPKGGLIALISNPTNGMNVFPEWKAKSNRVFKENTAGVAPTKKGTAAQTMGTAANDKAFQGAAVQTDMSDIQVLAAKFRFAFPGVTVVSTKAEFEAMLKQPNIRTKVSEGKIILGMTTDGKVFLNPEFSSLGTPIHEFGHVWIDFLRSKASGDAGTALLKKGLKLVEGTEALKTAIEKYGDNALAREEALVELMANKGETIIDAGKKSNFIEWLNATFKYIQKKFVRSEKLFAKEDIKQLKRQLKNEEITQEQYDKSLKKIQASVKKSIDSLTIEDFINTGLADLFGGKELSASFDAKKESKNIMFSFELSDNVVQFIKDARGQGISNVAIKTILNKRGVAMDVILESFKEAGDIANVESQVSENFAEGFDRVMKEIDGVVEKVKNRNTKDSTSPKKLYDASVSYLKGTRLYENATDVQREKMIVDLRKKFNQPIKKSITPQAAIKKASKKLGLDIKEPSKITLTQRQAIASQIKSLNRGAKDGIRSFIKASKAVAKEVSELVKKGKITTNQSLVIIKRFAKVNMLSESSIDSFVDYMAKVFANADYANTISIANNKRGTAKKNSSKGIGILNSLSGELQRIFSINPRMIPDSVLDNYMELINIFGGKESVLGKLPTLQKTTMLVNDILDTLNQEMSLIPELNKLYNEYEKVLNDDGEVSYAKTIKEMLKEEVITESEFELMKKYKSGIVPAKEKKELSEKEIKELKEDLKKEIDFQIAEYNPSNKDTQLPTRLERDAVKSLIKLSRNDKALDGLSLTDLKNLSKVFGNINNGYFPSVGFKLTENLQSVIDGEINSNAISRATPAKISMVVSRIKSLITKKDSIVELVRRNPLFNIDQIFGDYKTKDIFKSLFSQAAKGVANFNSDLNVVQRKVEKAITKVRKSKKINNDGNNFIKSAFEQMAWSIQNEFITNPESNQVNPVHKWLEATIKRIDKGTSQFSFSDAEVLQGILDTYYDADTQEFDNDALYESFNAEEKASIETIREINAGLTEKAVFTKSIIRGDKFTPLNNNIHINVLSATESVDISSGPSFAGKINEMMRPSSRGGNLEGRTGLVSKDGINFNIYDSVLKGSKGTLMDFHLTSPIRTARKTINKSEKNLTKKGRIPSNERLILNAISSAFEESVSNLLINSYTESSFGDAAMQFLKETGYRTMLAGSGRFIAELTSNASYAMVVDPQGFIVGTKVMSSIDSEMGPQIARNLGWENQGRLYADGLSGRMIDSSIINEAAGMKSKGTRSGAKNFLLKYWNKTGQKYVKGVEFMADVMISTPDKLVLRPITFGSFDVKFKEITGKSPDYKKIAANNEAYMNANKSALNAASQYANKKSVFAGATDNAFMGILKGTKKPNQSGLAQAINTFNNFMTRFLIYEYVTARTGIVNMVGRGDLSKKNGAALLAGVTSRMMLYTLIGQYTSYALSSLLDLDDDDDDYTIEDGVFKENKPIDQMKGFQKVLGQSFASTFTSLLLGRDFGNVAKSIINYGVEEFNKENLQFLRDGKYDQFKDSIQYTVSPKKKSMGGSTLGDYVLVLGAPFGPVLKTVDLIIRKITEPVRKTGEARERQLNEIGLRIPLEILGNLGMIPMYKDVRKAVLENIYKDLRKALAEAEDTKRIKEEMLQGFDSESDMKRYDYELWSNTFGPNSPGYDAREAKKKLKAAERKVKKQLKDELHDYTPKVKGKSTGFGRSERKSSGFGRSNKKSSGFGRSNKKSSGFGRSNKKSSGFGRRK